MFGFIARRKEAKRVAAQQEQARFEAAEDVRWAENDRELRRLIELTVTGYINWNGWVSIDGVHVHYSSNYNYLMLHQPGTGKRNLNLDRPNGRRLVELIRAQRAQGAQSVKLTA